MKQLNDQHQAGQSADALTTIRRVNFAKSSARSLNYKLLYAASAFFLLQSMSVLGIIDRIVYGPAWAGKSGDKVSQSLNLLSILISVYLFYSGTRKTRIARFNRFLPLAAPSLLLISVLWSADPRVSLIQGTEYFFVVLGAIGMVEVLDSDVLMDLVASICTFSAVASLVQFFIFAGPDDLGGIFSHKNVLGQVMVGGVLTALHGMRTSGRRRLRYICVIALCTFVAFMSKSATSILVIVVFAGLDILGRLYLRGGSTRITVIFLALGGIPFAIFLVMNPDSIFGLVGRDATLTGRTLIWSYVMDAISEKPLLGWGFSAFWSPLNPAAWHIADAVKWRDGWALVFITTAHNGLLEALLEIGLLGTSFFIFLWVRNFVMAIKCIKGPARQIGLSSVLMLIGILVTGVSEEVLVAPQTIWTNLFFIMGFMCEKKLRLGRMGYAGRLRAHARV